MSIHLASRAGILNSKATVPDEVIFRAFASETVLLNLATGRYFGLNETAGRMLEAMVDCRSVDAAARRLAAEYERSLDEVSDDICEFCLALSERGLLDLVDVK
jgi:hypothetical protein